MQPIIPTPEPGDELTVSGRVSYADGQPASELLVKVFEVGLCRKAFLKETSTRSDGTYEIPYSLHYTESIDTNTIGLLVEVYGSSERMLAASPIQYGLASTRIVDLVLPASERGPSEYERHLASIRPFLKDVSLAQLTCGDDDQDLAYLAGASGVPRDRLEMLVAAEQMARTTGYASAASTVSARKNSRSQKAHAKLFTSNVFYAWMRLGEPREREQILTNAPATLVDLLKRAVEENLIPALPAKDLDAIQSTLVGFHTVRVLQPATDGATASLGDALNLITGSNALSDRQKNLLAQLTANRTSESDAVDMLRAAKLKPAQTGRLRQIVALHQLSAGDGAMLLAAHQHVLKKSNGITTLPVHAIADLDESDWHDILKTAKPEMKTAEIRETAKNLVGQTAQLFPNAFLLSRAMRQPERKQLHADLSQLAKLQRHKKDDSFNSRLDELSLDDIPVGERRQVQASLDRMKKLVNRYPGLELDAVVRGNGSIAEKVSAVQKRLGLIEAFVTANPDTDFLALDYVPESSDLEALKFTGLQDSERAMVLQSMKAHWRAFRITGGALEAQQLMEAGIHSATATARMPLEEFINATNLPAREAAAIHAEASDITLNTSLLFTTLYTLLQPIGARTIFILPPQIVNHLKRYDGFKELFGAQAICRCGHCRSVLGPAAYFVDVMRFIDQNITQVVFDNNRQADQTLRLRHRRPDLWALPLTCENADTLVPTLDIVNEILENFIAGEQTPTANRRSEIQKTVYRQLAQAKDSFAQPYVLPLKEVETYLSHFQLTRAQIARALELDADQTARAWLGISLNERDLIVNTGTNAQLDRLFGLGITNSPLASTQLFLALGAWTRDELGQLVNTQFVQGGNAITIESGKASAASVQNDIEVVRGYSRPALDRLHRFTRLWRALRQAGQWSIPELDLILSSLSVAGVSPTVTSPMLAHIAKLLEIQKRLAISVEQLCALIKNIPTTKLETQRSFFDRLFNIESFVVQDRAWPPSPQPMYRHPSSLPGNASPANVLSSSKLTQRLIAGLQVSDEELVQLLEGLNWFSNGVSLTLDNLTLLYRHALLARTLQVKISDLFRLLALGAIPNFRVSDLAGLTQLIQIVDDWRKTGFSIDDLMVIGGGTATDPSSYPDAQAIAISVAEQIRTGHLLEFAATLLSQVQGITSAQSRTVIQQNPAVFESVPNSENIRLLAAADPGDGGFALAGVPKDVAMSSIVRQLNLYHTRNLLPKLLAAQFKLSEGAMGQLSAMCGDVLATHNAGLTQELYGSGATPILESIVTRFIPLVVLFKDRVWNESRLEFVARHPGVFGLTLPLFVQANAAPITFQTVLNVSSYAQLVGVREQGFTSEEAPPNTPEVETVLTQGFDDDATVAKALRVSPSRVGQLKTYLSLNNAKPFEGLRKLAQAISLTDLLGLSGAALSLLVPTTSDASAEYDQLTDAAHALVAVLRSKYPTEQTFAQTVEPYDDILRSHKRDGLVEYLIRSMNRGFATPSDLYQFFLIDTQVEGCARTARLVAAHGSLQLYVQRVLMNLERSGPDGPNEFSVLKSLANRPTNPLGRIQSEWEWRRTYRVWEANRKVFLYPESYLEPELRDDKTPPFKELESTLLQQRINEENATNAYAQYLEDYEEAASLRIAGAFHDINSDAKQDRLHLFGATADDPPVYYYRTIDNVRFTYEGKRKSYTPWRRLNVQIPVREVSPVIVDGRLLIFWVQITTTPTNKVEKGESRFVGYGHRFTFHYSEKRANDTWTPPQKLTAFDRSGLPFERLDDPLEEPPIIKPGEIFPAGTALTAAVIRASQDSDVFLIGEPILKPSDPTKLLTDANNNVLFRIVRLGPKDPMGFYPRYDESKIRHLEPVDGYTLKPISWTRIHAEVQGDKLFLTGMDTNTLQDRYKGPNDRKLFVGLVDLFERTARWDATPGQRRVRLSLVLLGNELWRASSVTTDSTVLFQSTMELLGSNPDLIQSREKLGNFAAYTDGVVVNRYFQGGTVGVAPDAIIDFGNDLVMFLLLDGLKAPAHDNVAAQALTGTSLERLGTTIRRELRKQLFMNGLGQLLSFDYQNKLQEANVPIAFPSTDLLIPKNLSGFSFNGPFGVYFQEIFFHIPFLIANNLNSQQRFAAAQRWYHYIFDPTSSDTGPNRVWQYRKFKEEFKEELLRPDAMRKALTDADALETYRRDPFNPHAIARLRPGSYQKAIVMKYIDNLLDWGDTLFTEFTMESLNEATLLYALAADILGPRAAEIGDCGEASAPTLTYAEVSQAINNTSDFLIELEHLVEPVPEQIIDTRLTPATTLLKGLTNLANRAAVMQMPMSIESTSTIGDDRAVGAAGGLMDFGGSNDSSSFWRTAGGTDLRSVSSYGAGQNLATNQPLVRGVDDPNGGQRIFVGGDPINPPEGGFRFGDGSIPDPGGLLPHDYKIPDKAIFKPGTFQPSNGAPMGGTKFPPFTLVEQTALPQPVFCIPPNKDLMAYWDRVEDRLYKIRNCMDITGARRRPSLYAPEIDPRQLVKDTASGLPLDDVLNGISGNVPPYRFSFLVDKAKQYASTVQSFGNALLSALEKKDAEQLSRLRAVQEQNLLKLRTRVQELEIEAAQDTLDALERQRESVELRQAFYETLLQNGLIPWERTQQVARHLVTSLHNIEATVWLVKAILSFLPNLGAPTAMKYGGMELSGAAAGFASINQALAQSAEAVSASAGLEATFQRRDEDWRQQKKLADKELLNIKTQIEGAKARLASANRSLEMHNRSIAQAEEIFQFYEDKFSSYGLYSFLSAGLQRSYREAYNAAFAVARMAEQAYRYEREYDSATALSNSYWTQDQAGLLAGEGLLLGLQNLERRYLETNYRTLEVEQSFSLTQIDPSALVVLRETGTCTFTIPEAFFDVAYPGQYRRRIKAVRLTIPCVVGPYTSVGAKLQLNDCEIRDNPTSAQPRPYPLRHTTVVAMSTAQNDSGIFEFNFRDERYIPFEGLGAVNSQWELSLPKTFRSFDYRTITDAVLRISYTAEQDATLRQNVDALNSRVSSFLQEPGIQRVFSLRHEFPDVWTQLVRKPLNTAVTLDITDRHLPYLLVYLRSNHEQSLATSPISILLQTKGGVPNPAPRLELNGNTVEDFQMDPPTGLPGKATGNVQPVRTHTIRVLNNGGFAPAAGQPGTIDESKLEDILLRVDLKLQRSE